jgi:FSR family fosmidomycin resistance protein-like MFS transporter
MASVEKEASREKANIGDAAPKLPLANHPHSKLRGILAFSHEVRECTPIMNHSTTDRSKAETISAAQMDSGDQFQADGVATIAVAHATHDTYTAFLSPLLPTFISSLSALMSLLGIVPSYGIMALLLVLVGFSSAGFHAVGPAMAGNLSGRNLGRGMSFWVVGGEIGRTIGPIVIVTIVRYFTIGNTPWLMIGGFIVSGILFIRLRDIPKSAMKVNQGLPWRSALIRMRPVMTLLVGLIIARSFMVSSLGIYLPIFLTEEGTNLWLAGASLSIVEAAGVAGALLGGSISDRLGRRLVLAISHLLAAIFMLVFLASTGLVRFPILMALGFSALSINPVIMALVLENFPENRALANGMYLGLSFVIRSGAIVIIGMVGDTIGLHQAFMASALLMLLGLPVIYLLPKDKLGLHKA